jgi:hypothetical protein
VLNVNYYFTLLKVSSFKYKVFTFNKYKYNNKQVLLFAMD